MVDALRSAWRVLRPRGHVVDVRPRASYRPALKLRRGRRALDVGTIVREVDEDVAAAARAVRSVVREGLFGIVSSVTPRSRATYADVSDLQRMVDASENWRLPAATRRRILARWREGDALEVTRTFSLTVLRRRAART